MGFYKFNVKTGRFTEILTTKVKECWKKDGCVPVWIMPYSKDEMDVFKRFKKYPPIMVGTTKVVGGRGEATTFVTIRYDPNKFTGDGKEKKVITHLKRDKRKWEEFLATAQRLNIAKNPEKAQKEFKRWLTSVGVDGFGKNTRQSWSVVYGGGKLKLLYPSYYKKSDAIIEILSNDETRGRIEKLIEESKQRFNLDKLKAEEVPLYNGDQIYFKGDFFAVVYKKSTRPGVKILPKKKQIIIRGKTLTEAKKTFVSFMHSEVLKEAKEIVGKLSRKYGIQVKLSDEKPGRARTYGHTYIPFGRTKMRVNRFTGKAEFEMMFRPELFLLEDWKRIHIYAHEFAHVIQLSSFPFGVLRFEEHDKNFYKILNKVLKENFPKIHKHEVRTLGHEVSNVEEENKLIGHNKFIQESIRYLSPRKLK